MTSPRWARWTSGIALGAAVIVALSACAGDDDSDSVVDSAAEAPADVGAASDSEASGGGGDAQAGDEGGTNTTPGSEEAGTSPDEILQSLRDRELVRTGDMRIVTEDIESAADSARRIASDAEGFVADEEVRARSASATLTVRMPAASFDAVREEMAELGDVAEQNVSVEDVTAEVVDLETRIGSMRASVERLQELFANAATIDELTRIEQELAGREGDLEALLAQERELSDQVALATLTVELVGPPPPEQPDVFDEDDDGLPSFLDGLGAGWTVLLGIVHIVLAVMGFLLPFAPPAAVLAVLVWWLIRRQKVVPSAGAEVETRADAGAGTATDAEA